MVRQIPRTALCSFVMDRPLTGLESWVLHNTFTSMIICDWSSRSPVINIPEIQFARDSGVRIYVVQAINQEKFYITKARNLTMRAMRLLENPLPEYTLMIDADVRLLKPLTTNLFFPAMYCKTEEKALSLYGTVLMPTKAFWDVNGYMETITFKHSDIDFYSRLNSKGYMMTRGLNYYLQHVDHPKTLSDRVVENTIVYQSEEAKKRWMESGKMEEIDVAIHHPDGRIEVRRL